MELPITTKLEASAILFHLAGRPHVWRQMDQVLLRAFAKDQSLLSPDDVKTAWSNLPFPDKKDFVDDYAMDIARGLGLALAGEISANFGAGLGADLGENCVSDLADLEALEAALD